MTQPEGRTSSTRGSNIIADGVDRIAALFCHRVGNGAGLGGRVLRNCSGIITRAQVLIGNTRKNRATRGRGRTGGTVKYLVEVYVDDFISFVVATSQRQLDHVANAVMHGIHDVFPPGGGRSVDPISSKKLGKEDGVFATKKCILGFDVGGEQKTIWLEEEKRAALPAYSGPTDYMVGPALRNSNRRQRSCDMHLRFSRRGRDS